MLIPTTVLTSTGGGGSMAAIQHQVLAVNTATFDFTSIPGTYMHLWMIMYLRGTKAATSVQAQVTFNGDTGANYDVEKHYAASNIPGAGGVINGTFFDPADAAGASSDAGAVSAVEILIPNYAGTTFHKTVTGKGFNPRAYSAGNEYVMNTGGLWKSTAAVTRITVTPDANSWAAGSMASLYGLS